MKDYISERAVRIANYIIQNNATVRQTAQSFGVSKSTVHKDVAERLLYINPHLVAEARKVLDVNKSERHIRGGLATRSASASITVLTTPEFLFIVENRKLHKIDDKGACLEAG